jgi:hypothetical protein
MFAVGAPENNPKSVFQPLSKIRLDTNQRRIHTPPLHGAVAV